jgi:hypothetical protein
MGISPNYTTRTIRLSFVVPRDSELCTGYQASRRLTGWRNARRWLPSQTRTSSLDEERQLGLSPPAFGKVDACQNQGCSGEEITRGMLAEKKDGQHDDHDGLEITQDGYARG